MSSSSKKHASRQPVRKQRLVRLPFIPKAGGFIIDGLGIQLSSFVLTDEPTADTISLDNVQPVASYSWVEALEKPTILVPASPDVWTNMNPRRVRKDSGFLIVDQNSYRMREKSPLIPLFAAVDEYTNHTFDYSGLDIVSDRSVLGRLVRWIESKGNQKGFRIDIDKAGKTCLFTRREEKDMEMVPEDAGYGNEYRRAATAPLQGLENTTGHNRIVNMNFGGINILLCFEVDACTEPIVENEREKDGEDNFVSTMRDLGISKTTPEQGQRLPDMYLEQDISITARSASSYFRLHDFYPELYLSSTPFLYVAKHTQGTFGDVQKIALSDMGQQADSAQLGVAKLKQLLEKILGLVRKTGETKFSLVCKDKQIRLYMRERGSGKAIPTAILKKFAVDG